MEFVPKLLPRGRSNSQAAPRLEAIDGEWRVTLMTPALLCDPTSLTRSSGNGTELLEAYRKSWLEISGKTLHLKRFFARQTLAGSYYLYSRFRNGDCLPWLLTDAGSVFVLEAAKDQKEQDVANFISTAWTGGLKLPMWAKEKDGTPWDWETCPFVRENGYGEVAVNLDIKNVALPEEGVTDVDAI